jgi:VanZ family protein
MAPRLNIAIKALLVGLIAASLVFGDSERFSDKAMGARAIAYPLLCALPAAGWWVARRRRPTLAYPHLFDRLTWFDDAAHFTNWFLLGLALGFTLRHTRPSWEVVWLVTGAGAVAAILWELAEYQSFVQKVEQLGIYRDTVGDLCLGTSGALVAGVLVVISRRMWPASVSGG